ncbi:MAG: FHA domain-containing protein [Gemmatales bacterium]|nr:FHA domain-containing protein [Gemmatales bacterium]MDW8223322.1 FHA domain-containing protein [Gemmatales bacterium]
MSFRLYVYYMALGGAWGALGAWLASWLIFGVEGQTAAWKLILEAGAKGALLGALVGAILGLFDNFLSTGGRWSAMVPGAIAGLVLGGFAGLIGGLLGQVLAFLHEYLRIVGWVVAGALIGFGICVWGLVKLLLARAPLKGVLRKVRNGVIGGTLGGLLGGLALVVIAQVLTPVLRGRAEPLSPAAIGWTILGALLGLFIGLAQVILRDAWVIVESGFRPGREIPINKAVVAIGRAEGCDIGLYGGKGVEKLHARIIMDGAEYFLEDCQTPGGTFVNERRVVEKQPLQSGDRIRVGDCVLIFRARARRPAPRPEAVAPAVAG